MQEVKIYKIMIIPIMIYGAESWALKKTKEKLERREMTLK